MDTANIEARAIDTATARNPPIATIAIPLSDGLARTAAGTATKVVHPVKSERLKSF